MTKNWAREIARAERVMKKNKALIDAGETFRSQKKADYRRESASKAGKRTS